MKRILVAALALLAAVDTFAAAPERSIMLDAVKLETIRIEGRVQTWLVDKVCIDGQAYLMVLGSVSPSAIAPAYKDGKPEQCQSKAAKSP
jgi:hypothetical protein